MATIFSGKSKTLSLADWQALNEELAALVRAGVPLEAGLAQMGRDLPGRWGDLAARLARRLNGGDSLAAALKAEGAQFPEVYHAVVEAGLRSGRLALALEAVNESARRTEAVRRTTGAALLYPILLVLVAWELFCFFAVRLGPAFAMTPEAAGPAVSIALVVQPWVRWLAPLGPMLILLAAVWWWRSSGDARRQSFAWRLLGLPDRRRMILAGQSAVLAELTALLVEHAVPLDEALSHAARGSGNLKFCAAAERFVAALQAGLPNHPEALQFGDLPAQVRVLLLTSTNPERLAHGLHRAADGYRRQAQRAADRLQWLLPLLLTGVFGASVTLGYLLLVLTPYFQILWRLSQG